MSQIHTYEHVFSTQVAAKTFISLSVIFRTALGISGSAPAVIRGWRGRDGVARKRVVVVGGWLGGVH